MTGRIKKLKKETDHLKRSIFMKSIGYVMVGLGLVVGLAWNEAIKALIEEIFPISKNTVLAKFFYAAILTAVIVVVGAYLVRLSKKEEVESQKK